MGHPPTDQASNQTQQAFDALNRLYQITDPANGITATSYDAHDRPLIVTSPTGVTTTYVYDGFGDLIQESNSNTGKTVYNYDGDGNLTERVAATGATTQYTYDALDRLVTKTFPADSAENVTYTYDQSGHGAGIGRLTSVTDAAGTLSRSYDQLGNLLSDVRTTSAATLTTAYTYDAANRIVSIAYPSGATVSYTRDTMGRITAVAARPSGGVSAPVVSNVTYEPFGPYNGLTNGNGVAEARGFDQDYRLTGIIDMGTSTLKNLTYAYYPTNNVQTVSDAINPGSSVGSTSTSYGYGTGSDRLATLSVGGIETQAIGYTADGRIASLNPGIQAPGGQFITSLGYNQDGRLAAVNTGGGALASYTYDGFGQRLIKTVSASYGELYQYGQNGLLLEETNASGVAQADYIYLNGRPVAVLNGSTLYYLHDDMLGTPQLATDSNQAVAWQASYDPFGQASASGTITQNLRFPGQYFDVESGWNHNGFRDYLPALGRYAEPDPLGRLGSGNDLYAYVYNNPANLVDPFGLQDNASPWQVGWEWLTGTGPRVHNFTDGDPFTELLRHHQHIQELINDVCNGTLPPSGQFNYNLGGLGGVPKYLQDYSTLFTGGLTGNLAVTYLGSYGLTYSETNGVLDIQVTNTSSIASATHPPVIGYTNWWNNNIGTPLNNFFSSGPMSATTQNFDFHENLAGRGCGCKGAH